MKNTLSGFSEVDLNSTKSEKGNSANFSSIDENVYKEYQKIKNLSNEEAKSKLFEEVVKQKQNGSFNYEALARHVESLQGYLPEKDYKNLKKMLESLR